MTIPVRVPDLVRVRGFAVYCDLGKHNGWQDGLKFIENAGLSVVIPRQPTHVLTIADDGDRIDVADDDFDRLAAADGSLMFKAWTPRADDMLCEYVSTDAVSFERYWFSYLAEGQDVFVKALVQRFEEQAARTMQILVVDWAPISEEFDWTAFLAGQIGYSGAPPEILAVPKSYERLLRLEGLETAEFAIRREHDHVIVTRISDPTAPVSAPAAFRPA